MIWTYLRSCYGWTMRLYIGGQERHVPARWFFCLPSALEFPFVHGAEASPWLANYEDNPVWGEITPYPRDPASNLHSTLDRGRNPGYPGLCYVGDPQWFVDGMLPANIEDGPIPPFPSCCFPGPVVTSGGLVLGGSAVASGRQGYASRGGLALGGSAAASGSHFYATAGGLALGGSAKAGAGYRTSGGLVLGGSASATGGGGSPGPDCNDAGVLNIGVFSNPQSFAVANYWWKVNLAAGQVYHVLVTSSTIDYPLYWSIFSGSCASLQVLANDGYACTQFTAPYTGSFPLQATVAIPNPGTWQIGVFLGACP